MLHKLYALLKAEFINEWRNASTFTGMLLYAVAACYLIYILFKGDIGTITYIATFWLLMLFVTINAIGRSMTQNLNEQYYFLRQFVSPHLLIVTKIIYNAILAIFIGVIVQLLFMLFFPDNINNQIKFLAINILGVFGLASLFTLLSAISAGTNNISITAVLGFPIVLPLLMLIVRLSGFADFSINEEDYRSNLAVVALLDSIIVIMSLILFPFLWKE